jgi:hypothetical protein
MRYLKLFEQITGEIDKMVTKVNDMLTNYKKMGQDRKKWAIRYRGNDDEQAALFKIASSVIDGKIRNSEIKDKVSDFVMNFTR